VTVAVIAVAPITPMLGIVSSRRLASLTRCWAWLVAKRSHGHLFQKLDPRPDVRAAQISAV
jgi:hypothetical protein